MPSAKQVLSMLRSRVDRDEDQFLSTALQIAAAEARQGRRTSAEQIRAAVKDVRKLKGERASTHLEIARPRGDLEGLLDFRQPDFRLCDVVLSEGLRDSLDWVVLQQQRRTWLREGNRTPSRRLLFAGPPGTGKTMAAGALADKLHLPFFTVRLESLITRYMGETSAKLRLIFNEAMRRRGVYLFDEFDAVGSRRAATNDVGEIRRVLNSFLQFMEEPTSTDSLVLAATNHPDLLDSALQRRFDEALRFQMPSKDEARQVIRNNLRPMKCSNIKWEPVMAVAEGLSQAELARSADEAAKIALLHERDDIRMDELLGRLQARQDMRQVFAGKGEQALETA